MWIACGFTSKQWTYSILFTVMLNLEGVMSAVLSSRHRCRCMTAHPIKDYTGLWSAYSITAKSTMNSTTFEVQFYIVIV